MRLDFLSECAGTLADARRAIESSQARMRRIMDAIKADPARYERWLEGLCDSMTLLARVDAGADVRSDAEEKVAAEQATSAATPAAPRARAAFGA